ncbi:putative secreted protein [Corynebacterium deserti GIMN1.010]|uniref:Putative secreted protein n=1 Tax=Corynebacterium deserti GIMN1.010 TaxID=931089 RepID=A0A0M4CI86_9CORY|nr:putative secreted protein [Corynebacterium deserti GIMN1.010]
MYVLKTRRLKSAVRRRCCLPVDWGVGGVVGVFGEEACCDDEGDRAVVTSGQTDCIFDLFLVPSSGEAGGEVLGLGCVDEECGGESYIWDKTSTGVLRSATGKAPEALLSTATYPGGFRRRMDRRRKAFGGNGRTRWFRRSAGLQVRGTRLRGGHPG